MQEPGLERLGRRGEYLNLEAVQVHFTRVEVKRIEPFGRHVRLPRWQTYRLELRSHFLLNLIFNASKILEWLPTCKHALNLRVTQLTVLLEHSLRCASVKCDFIVGLFKRHFDLQRLEIFWRVFLLLGDQTFLLAVLDGLTRHFVLVFLILCLLGVIVGECHNLIQQSVFIWLRLVSFLFYVFLSFPFFNLSCQNVLAGSTNQGLNLCPKENVVKTLVD